MALENWIDELVRASEIMLQGKPVRGFRLYEKSEFPGSLILDNIPCALTFVRGVDCEYGNGPCFDIWKGSIEYHLTKNLNRDQLPEILRSIRRIRDAFALYRTLGGKVAYCALETENSIVGPVKLQYGSEEEHLGLVANWWVKEITASEINLGGAPGSFSFGHLLATGQLTQYGGYLDDGYYKKGIVKAYTILTTGQYAGTVAITLNGKTDTHKNECVVDNNTGLMWSRYCSAILGPGSDGKLPWTTNGNGEGIFAYCAAANAANLAGYSDWRVPNRNELNSLVDDEAPTGVPDSTAFPTWVNTYLWSSNTRPDSTTYALANYFADGGSIATLAKTLNYYCILVRG